MQPDAEKLNLTAAADVAGVHGAFHGRAGDPLTAPSLDGDLTLSGDAGKIWASVTGAPPAPLPARLSAHLVTEPGALKAQNLTGAWGDAGFSGALAFDAEGIGGTLNCDHLSAPAAGRAGAWPAGPGQDGRAVVKPVLRPGFRRSAPRKTQNGNIGFAAFRRQGAVRSGARSRTFGDRRRQAGTGGTAFCAAASNCGARAVRSRSTAMRAPPISR